MSDPTASRGAERQRPETQKTERVRTRSPARATAVVSAMLIVSFLAFPAGVTEWLSDRCEEGAACRVLVGFVRGVERASRQVGVAGLFEAARDEARRDLDIDQD